MKKRGGFTLIELIIVMTIIGVIYTLLIQNFTFKDESEEAVSIATLPKFLRKKYAKKHSLVTFRCFDGCEKCSIFIDQNEKATLELFEAKKEVLTYTLGTYEAKKVEFSDFYVDEYKSEKVCFEYHVYPNGSSDKMIVEYDEQVYLLRNYEQETKVFSRVGDAEEFWRHENEVALKE